MHNIERIIIPSKIIEKKTTKFDKILINNITKQIEKRIQIVSKKRSTIRKLKQSIRIYLATILQYSHRTKIVCN